MRWLRASVLVLLAVMMVSRACAMQADADFNNDGQAGTELDLRDFFSVFSEGPCSTGNCDSIDINGDGSLFDPVDSDIYVNQVHHGLPVVMPWSPAVDEFGRSVLPPLDARDRLIHVSSSAGSDLNPGTRDLPVRTLWMAERLARHDHGDRILLADGDVWTEQLRGEYGPWNKGGASRERPFVISRYAPRPGLPGPVIRWRNPNPQVHGSTIRLQGEEFDGFWWLVDVTFDVPPEPDSAHATINVYARATDIVIEGCTVRGGNSLGNFDGVVSHGLRNLVLRSNYIGFTNRAGGAHAGGCYVVRAEGLLASGNVWEHNGWGAVRDFDSKFCQVFYLVADAGTFQQVPAVVVNNLFTDPAHCGVQARAGLVHTVWNTVTGAPIAYSGGHAMAAASNPWRGVIANNVTIDYAACPGAAQGESIRVSRGGPGWVFGNRFVRPRQTIVYEQPVGVLHVSRNVTVLD